MQFNEIIVELGAPTVDVIASTPTVSVTQDPQTIFVDLGAQQGLAGAPGTIALDEHLHSPDPHPQYLTPTEAQELINAALTQFAAYGGVRRYERVQADPVTYQEFIHDWGIDPFAFEVLQMHPDGTQEEISDRVVKKIIPGVGVAVTTNTPIAYRIILAG